ncbi:MAG: hypothetical protein CMN78_01380 [Spirochaetales bacterium]|nr:hypothetical protein [Spirochaetales bacterium]
MKPWLRILVIGASISVTAVAAGAIILQQLQTIKMRDDITARMDLLVEEIRKNSEIGEETRQNLFMLSDRSNEIRRALRLPQARLSYEIPVEDQPEGQEFLPYFQGVDALLQSWRREQFAKKYIDIENYINSSSVLRDFKAVLVGNFIVDLQLESKKAYMISSNRTEHALRVDSITGESRLLASLAPSLEEFVGRTRSGVEGALERRAELIVHLRAFAADEKTVDFLQSNELALQEIQTESEGFELPVFVVRKGERLLARMGVDLQSYTFFVDEVELSSATLILNQLKNQIGSMDIRSNEEIQIEMLQSHFATILADEGFGSFLNGKELELVDGGREDSDYYYYDLVDADGVRVGAFGIQKFIGEVYLVDHEDVPISSLKAMGTDIEKKN